MRYLWAAYIATYRLTLEVIVMAAEARDFTKAFEPPSFKIDDDVFFGRRKINGGAAMAFAQQAEGLTDENNLDPESMALMLKRLFRLTLKTSSYRRMAARIDATLGEQAQRMLDDLDPAPLADNENDDDLDARLDDDVLDLTQLNEIGEWLLGEYGLRPTEPSSNSSDSQDSQDAGTNSTEKPSPQE